MSTSRQLKLQLYHLVLSFVGFNWALTIIAQLNTSFSSLADSCAVLSMCKVQAGAKYCNYLFPPQHLNHWWFLTPGHGSNLLYMGMMRTETTTTGASHVAQTVVPHLLADVLGALCPPLREETPLLWLLPGTAHPSLLLAVFLLEIPANSGSLVFSSLPLCLLWSEPTMFIEVEPPLDLSRPLSALQAVKLGKPTAGGEAQEGQLMEGRWVQGKGPPSLWPVSGAAWAPC